MKTDAEFLETNKHIPSSEVRADIKDTQREILEMGREIQGLRLIGDRLSNFRADAKEQGVKNRQTFINDLRRLLALRKEKKHEKTSKV